MHPKGNAVKWATFTDKRTGILHAMRALSLDGVALPGARLPDSFVPPKEWNMNIKCRSGEQYDSCAFLWNSVLNTLSPVPDLGSDRRLHFAVPRLHKDALLISCVYLHTNSWAQNDDKWLQELRGLSEDLRALRRRFGPAEGRLSTLDFLIVGDMNLQPCGLGDGPDRSKERDTAWSTFLGEHGLTLLNPLVGGGEERDVYLPLRDTTIRIKPGHTHHHIGGGSSRAIDLVAATCGVQAEVCIHNTIHCSSLEPCGLPLCCEYTSGDHFLIEVTVQDDFVAPDAYVMGSMPGWLHDAERWTSGWLAARSQIDKLCCFVCNTCLRPRWICHLQIYQAELRSMARGCSRMGAIFFGSCGP